MPRASREELAEVILKSANDLFRVMLPTLPREVLLMDFTMPQLKAMFLLFFNGPMRMSDLAANLGVTLATTTGLIDRLVERELVIRESDPGDRRVVRCRLSASGEESISQISKSAMERMRALLLAMPVDNLEALSRVLKSMCPPSENNKT
jgi:DNA-binding MarR family transcriptional regulator